jgi:hypothetical protein
MTVRIAIPPALSPAAFHRRQADAPVVTCAGQTMGTSWSARIVAAPEGITLAIQAELDRVVAEMSHWAPDSALSRFNRSDPGRWQPLPIGFAKVLAAALDVADKSDGAFDPAMGALVDLWGFGPPGPREDLPSNAEIAAARAASGRIHIEQDDRRARRTAPVALDFSGIAKGHGVDRVAEMLRSMELHDFLVEVGGELRGAGIKPDGQPWWVDLEAPPGSRAARPVGRHLGRLSPQLRPCRPRLCPYARSAHRPPARQWRRLGHRAARQLHAGGRLGYRPHRAGPGRHGAGGTRRAGGAYGGARGCGLHGASLPGPAGDALALIVTPPPNRHPGTKPSSRRKPGSQAMARNVGQEPHEIPAFAGMPDPVAM